MRIGPIFTALLIAAILLFGVIFALNAPQAVVAAPQEQGTVTGYTVRTFMNAKVLTGTLTTTYTAVPLNQPRGGADQSLVADWYTADTFVTVDLDSGAAVTVTAQASADTSNWMTPTFGYYYGTQLDETVTTVTATEQTTVTLSSTPAFTTGNYFTTRSTDGTSLFQLPIAGAYMRYAIEYTGSITLTIKTVLKDNGG